MEGKAAAKPLRGVTGDEEVGEGESGAHKSFAMRAKETPGIGGAGELLCSCTCDSRVALLDG